MKPKCLAFWLFSLPMFLGIILQIYLLDFDIQSFSCCNSQIEAGLEIEFKNRFKLMPGVLVSVFRNLIQITSALFCLQVINRPDNEALIS